MSVISSRTPEGQPAKCPVCGTDSVVVTSTYPTFDVPCPRCGCLLILPDMTPGRICPISVTQKMQQALDDVAELVERATIRHQQYLKTLTWEVPIPPPSQGLELHEIID